MNAAEAEAAFAAALATTGLAPVDGTVVVADGKWHRFRGPGDKPGRKNHSAVLHADGAPHGYAKSWLTGHEFEWLGDRAPITKAGAALAKKTQNERRKARDKQHVAAAKKARELFGRLSPAEPAHPYLVRKSIGTGPCRVMGNGVLVLPVIHAETGLIMSLQFIGCDGDKRFMIGGRTAEGCLVLGDLDGDDRMVIAEGFATGMSIRAATGAPVVVAFNAGNLGPVAKIIRKRFPERSITIAADNDLATPGNPGVTKATEAALAVVGLIAVPPGQGDFNDLAADAGIDAVRAALGAATEPARASSTHSVHELAASAAEIIASENILEEFVADWRKIMAGEERNAMLLYLVATSRLFDKPMHAALKGASSSGKSQVRGRVLDFFPPEDVISFTALSEKALLYFEGDFTHMILSMGEAAGAKEQEFQDYLLRELMSEGRLSYPVPQKVAGEIVTITIEKTGPVCFLVTTTRDKLHPENETRLLSLEIDDSEAQTRAVLDKLAEDAASASTGHSINFARWHDFQRYLAACKAKVVIPYAPALSKAIETTRAVRLRRDFGQVLRAVMAHALIHQGHRERDPNGAIVADIDHDYAVVRNLMHDVIAVGVDAQVTETMRATIDAVARLSTNLTGDQGVTATAVGKHLRVDKSVALRRLTAVVHRGYIVNLEQRRGQPGKYRLTAERPDDADVLPTPERVKQVVQEFVAQPVQPRNPEAELEGVPGVDGDLPAPQPPGHQERVQVDCMPVATDDATVVAVAATGTDGMGLHGCGGDEPAKPNTSSLTSPKRYGGEL